MIKEKIMKIMELALEINPPEIDKIGRIRPGVSVLWFPHYNYLEIDIYENGWTPRCPCKLYGTWTYDEYASERLDAIIDVLEDIKARINLNADCD